MSDSVTDPKLYNWCASAERYINMSAYPAPIKLSTILPSIPEHNNILYSVVPVFSSDNNTNILSRIDIGILLQDNTYIERYYLMTDSDKISFNNILSRVVGTILEYKEIDQDLDLLQISSMGQFLFSFFTDCKELVKNGTFDLINNKIPICTKINATTAKKIYVNVNGIKYNVNFTNRDLTLLMSADTEDIEEDYTIEKTSTDIYKLHLRNLAKNTICQNNACRILLENYLQIEELCLSELKLDTVPITLAAIAEQYTLSLFETEEEKNKFLGIEKQISTYANKIKAKRNITTIREVTHSKIVEDIISSSYYGGYNTSFLNKNYECASNEYILDIDLSSAYCNCLSAMNNADFSKVRKITDYYNITVSSIEDLPQEIRDLFNDIYRMPYSFFEISFTFDNDILFPSIPVKNEYDSTKGIYYPLNGDTFVTGIELISTLKNYSGRVRITLKDIVIIPQSDTNTFSKIFCTLIEKRNKYTKDDYKYGLLKQIANSVYGKVVQSKKGYSELYNIVYGATATAICRATINDIIYCLTANDFKIINVITDGLAIVAPKLTDISVNDTDNKVIIDSDITKYISADILKKLVKMCAVKLFIFGTKKTGSSQWLKVKHISDFALWYKSRIGVLKYNNNSQYKMCSSLPLPKNSRLIEDIYSSQKVKSIDCYILPTLRDVIKNNSLLVVKKISRMPTISPDSKRIYIDTFSKPVKSIFQSIDIENYIYTNKSRGKITTDTDIEEYLLSKATGLYNVKDLKKRYIYLAVAQRIGIFEKALAEYKDCDIARLLGLNDIKNLKRAGQNYTTNCLFASNTNKKLIQDIFTSLNIDNKYLVSAYQLLLDSGC